MGLETLYDARNAPMRGVNTAVDPMALPGGVPSELVNARLGEGLIEARGGMTAVLSSISTTAEFRGCWGGYLWDHVGTGYQLVVAVYDTSVSKTRVYYSTSPSGSWTELTAAAGSYGDTRLTNNAPVRFATIPNPFAASKTSNDADALIFCDGGAPRVACSASAGSACIVYEVTPQTGVQNTPVRVHVVDTNEWINLQAATPAITGWESPTDNTGQTDFLLSGTGSAPNKQYRLTIGTATQLDNITTVASGFDLSVNFSSPQDRVLLVGVDTAYPLLWDNVGIEFRTQEAAGGTVLTIWDPSEPNNYAAPIPIGVDNSNRTLWVFKFPKQSSGVNFGFTRYTWHAATNKAPTAAVTADIWLFAISQGSAAYADYSLAVTSYNTASRSESPGVIYSEYDMQRVQDLGGPVLNGLKLPRSGVLDCTFYAKVRQPTSAADTTGVDVAHFYYKIPGDPKYRFAHRRTFSGAADTVTEEYAGPSYDYVAQNSAVYLPDAYHLSAPNASEVCWANDRLFVGAAPGAKHGLLISERGHGLRFRRFTELRGGAPDPDGAVTLSIGSANVKAILPMASSLIGVDTVFVLTDQEVFATSGTDSASLQRLSRVSRFGTVSPLSVAELNNRVIYLDVEGQIRELGNGGVQPLTRRIVDDQLKAIPDAYKKYVSAAVWDEKYYISFPPAGGTTNTKMLVLDDAVGWVNDEPPVAAQGLLAWHDGAKKRLLAFGPNTGTATTLSAYEYDLPTQSQDLGTTNITVKMTFADIHSADGKGLFVDRVGVTMDQVTGSTGTVTRTYKPHGGTGVGSLDISDANPQIVRYDGEQTITGEGNGSSARVRLELPMTAGKKVYKVVAEVTPRDHGYDRS